MRAHITRIAVGLFALVVGASAASAAPILTFPGTLAGTTFTVESVTPSADLFPADGSDTYLVILRLQTTTAYVGDGDANADFLQSVALDFGNTLDAGVLQSFSGPVAMTWNTSVNTGINGSSACNGTLLGSICVEDASAAPNLAMDANAIYEWGFRVDLPASGFGPSTTLLYGIAEVNASSGQFQDISGSPFTSTGGQLTGEQVAAVPEPTSMFLFGTALAGLAARRARLRRQQ